jgi:hypothetical protein
MAATYSVLGAIAQQNDFQNRVAFAMHVAAVLIYAEAMATSAATASANNTLHFAATPAAAIVGAPIFDLTTSGAIPAGTIVSSVTATTVVMSQAATGSGVLAGDAISFVSNHAARAAFATKVLNGNFVLFNACLGTLTNPTIMTEANPAIAGNGIPDTDIQFQVNSIWNALAGA